MKFTSEDLLKAMGLKLGDKIRVYKKEHEIILNPHSNTIDAYCEEVNSSTPLYIFVDEEIEIIQPKPTLTEDEKVILIILGRTYKNFVRERDGIFTECFPKLFNNLEYDKIYSIEELLKEK